MYICAICLFPYTFLCIGFALLIGNLLGKYYLGFLIISGVFLILFVVVFLWVKPIIEEKTIQFFNDAFKD